MADYFSTLFQSEKYADCNVVVSNDKKEIIWTKPLHKLVLAQSPMLQARFDRWSSPSEEEVEMLELVLNASPTAINLLFHSLYDKYLNLPYETLDELLTLTDFFMLDAFGKRIVSRIFDCLNADNIPDWIMNQNFAVKERCRYMLFRDGYDMYKDNISRLCQIPTPMLIDILTCDSFWAPSEISRYTFFTDIAKVLGTDFFNSVAPLLKLPDLNDDGMQTLKSHGFLDVNEIVKRQDCALAMMITNGRIKNHLTSDFDSKRSCRFGLHLEIHSLNTDIRDRFIGYLWRCITRYYPSTNSLSVVLYPEETLSLTKEVDMEVVVCIVGDTKIYKKVYTYKKIRLRQNLSESIAFSDKELADLLYPHNGMKIMVTLNVTL